MWESRIVVPFETRLKMTPFCCEWQSVCWVMLRIYYLLELAVLDRSATYLVAMSVLMISLVIAYSYFRWRKMYKKNKVRKQRQRQRRHTTPKPEAEKTEVRVKKPAKINLPTKTTDLAKTKEQYTELLDLLFDERVRIEGGGFVSPAEILCANLPGSPSGTVLPAETPTCDSSDEELQLVEPKEVIKPVAKSNLGKTVRKRKCIRSPTPLGTGAEPQQRNLSMERGKALVKKPGKVALWK